MAFKLKNFSLVTSINQSRRQLLQRFMVSTGLAVLTTAAVAPNAKASEKAKEDEELRFPGDPADHKVVYQFNKGDETYHKAILFSVGAVLRKYGDNVQIVVVGIGPGIHVLGKNPKRPVTQEVREKISSLIQYGVKFHACGNTMKGLKWTAKDIIDNVKIVEVGAADLMELQEQGYSYISW